MNVVIAVIVYNRFRNIVEWVRCFKKSQNENAELVIIHNARNQNDIREYSKFCRLQGVKYISCANVGFDIGRFQDVCNKRLHGFPDVFDLLLWCTDDILPMRTTFINEFREAFKEGVVCACYEISKEVHPHIRTTGFMLHKDTLSKIRFNVDPIRTKPECYDFEHRDKVNSLIDQVSKFGQVVQVHDVENSALWDTGHNSREGKARFRRREREHFEAFK
jgi:hypothetical protein